jgi:hypothetical protein
VKPIIIPNEILSVYLHFPLLCLDGDRTDKFCKLHRPYPEDLALVYRYRKDFLRETDNTSTPDTTVWKYKDDLIREVAVTLNETGFKP